MKNNYNKTWKPQRSPFNPGHEFIREQTEKYLKSGGKITYLFLPDEIAEIPLGKDVDEFLIGK